jgi:hypothetical protein
MQSMWTPFWLSSSTPVVFLIPHHRIASKMGGVEQPIASVRLPIARVLVARQPQRNQVEPAKSLQLLLQPSSLYHRHLLHHTGYHHYPHWNAQTANCG